jgi:hypothetical protein
VATALIVDLSWADVARGIFIPQVVFSRDCIVTIVAVLGTTISPYLFFWQAEEEVEETEEKPRAEPLKKAPKQAAPEIRRIEIDTYLGMAVSNIVALFIVVTTAATLHAHGVSDIQTSADAAKALKPLAGDFAFALFACGIGTGLLAGSCPPVVSGPRLLRHHCGRDSDRRDHEFSSHRSHQRAVLERCHQRSRLRTDHGDHDAGGDPPAGNGRFRAAATAALHGLAFYSGDGAGGCGYDRKLGRLRLFASHLQPVLACRVAPMELSWKECPMGRGILLWLLGIPIPVIILILLFWH